MRKPASRTAKSHYRDVRGSPAQERNKSRTGHLELSSFRSNHARNHCDIGAHVLLDSVRMTSSIERRLFYACTPYGITCLFARYLHCYKLYTQLSWVDPHRILHHLPLRRIHSGVVGPGGCGARRRQSTPLLRPRHSLRQRPRTSRPQLLARTGFSAPFRRGKSRSRHGRLSASEFSLPVRVVVVPANCQS